MIDLIASDCFLPPERSRILSPKIPGFRWFNCLKHYKIIKNKRYIKLRVV